MGRILFIIFLIFLAVNIIFVKKRKIEIKYSMILVLGYIIFMILSSCRGLNKCFGDCTGVVYVSAFAFTAGIIISFLIILYLMTVISDINGKVTRLMQQNAILNDKINERLK